MRGCLKRLWILRQSKQAPCGCLRSLRGGAGGTGWGEAKEGESSPNPAHLSTWSSSGNFSRDFVGLGAEGGTAQQGALHGCWWPWGNSSVQWAQRASAEPHRALAAPPPSQSLQPRSRQFRQGIFHSYPAAWHRSSDLRRLLWGADFLLPRASPAVALNPGQEAGGRAREGTENHALPPPATSCCHRCGAGGAGGGPQKHGKMWLLWGACPGGCPQLSPRPWWPPRAFPARSITAPLVGEEFVFAI